MSACFNVGMRIASQRSRTGPVIQNSYSLGLRNPREQGVYARTVPAFDSRMHLAPRVTAALRRNGVRLGLLLAAVALQFGWMDASVGIYDEGLTLFGADRVLRGDVPYRDFWTIYGPGNFYALAALFRVFGEQVLVERAFDIAAKTAIVVNVYAIVRVFAGRAVGLGAAALSLGLVMFLRSYGAPVFPAMAALLTAVSLLRHESASTRPGACAAAGVAVAAGTLFRHDLGAYAFVALGIYFVRCVVAASRDAERHKAARDATVYVLAYALTLAPVAVGLAWSVPGQVLYRDLIEIPLFVYPRVRHLPFPPIGSTIAAAYTHRSAVTLGALVVYLPLVALAIALAAEWARSRRNLAATVSPQDHLFHLLVLLTAFFFAKGYVRVSPFQMGPALIAAVVLVASTAGRARHRTWRIALLAVVAIGGLVLLVKPIVTSGARQGATSQTSALMADRWITHARALCADTSIPRLRCMRMDNDRAAIVRYLLDHGASGKKVYVGTGRHDRLLVSDLSLAFAAGIVAPTHWHDLHPGVQTTREVQEEMIAELGRSEIAYVVLDRAWDDEREPNASAHSSGVTVLDDYLRRNFHEVFVAGPLTVSIPNDGVPRR